MKPFKLMILLVLGLLSWDELGAQSLRGLGTLGPDGSGYSYSFPTGISADGQTIVGESSSAQGTQAFLWTSSSRMLALGTLGPDSNGISYSRANGISSDGMTVVGQTSSSHGYVSFAWTNASGMVDLGSLNEEATSFSYPTGVSADGSIIVGDHANGPGYDAFVWTAQTGMIRLGTPPAADGGYSYSRAAAISADGTTVVGERTNGSRSIAVVWTKIGEGWAGADLGTLETENGPADSRAIGVSADGMKVIGQHLDAAGMEAFVWSAANDEMVGLGTLQQSGGFSEASAISSDGSTIIGESYNGSFTEAFRWANSTGMSGLGSLGGDSYANGVSGDGAMIAGFSASGTGTQAYLWTEDGGQVGLGSLKSDDSGFIFSAANGISADGSTVYGHSLNDEGVYEAFLFRTADAVEVLIDVDPKSKSNKINLHSQKMSVAILTTSDFDATSVDPATVVLGDPGLVEGELVSGAWVGAVSSEIADVDRDGDDDLQLVFDPRTLAANGALNDRSQAVLLKGQTFGGYGITGNAVVTIVPQPKKSK